MVPHGYRDAENSSKIKSQLRRNCLHIKNAVKQTG